MKDVFGANVVRLQLKPVTEATRNGISIAAAWQKQLDKMEFALKDAARRGMYVIIDLHEPPIADPSQTPTTVGFWNNEANLQILIDSWKEIAQRFAPYRYNIWGYDLLNEPTNPQELPQGVEKWPDWAQQIVNAIRVYDTQTPIIYQASPGALPKAYTENQLWQREPTFRLLNDDKVIYSFHMYTPYNYTHQGLSSFNQSPKSTDWPDKTTYPGKFDKSWLLKELQPVIAFQKKYNVPIYVGEFSAIRWAPGAADYIRDLISIFEEYRWSYTYHGYGEWQGWDVEYNETMTSDANRWSAKATEPTDRELILKAYFARNRFLTPFNIPSSPYNLVQNGNFQLDSNMDGVADYWRKAPQAAASVEKVGESTVQKVTVPQEGGGLYQAWIPVSSNNRYLFRAKTRVDSGKVKFMRFDGTDVSSNVGTDTMAVVPNTGGQFVGKEYQFVPPVGVTRVTIWFWADSASQFMVKDAELFSLGPFKTETPPLTTVSIPESYHLQFQATPQGDRSIVRTEFRIVGQSAGWTTVPKEGLFFVPGQYLVAYRSVDSAGVVERAKSILFTSVVE
jgi:hypothetical protein